VRSLAHLRRRLLNGAGVALAATIVAAPAATAVQAPGVPADVAVKAAFLYNFAKFAEWPKLPDRAVIAACVVGDSPIADALVGIVSGKDISGHGLRVVRPMEEAAWHECHLLFVAGSQVPLSTAGLGGVRTLPVLTVSDSTGFSRHGGIVEFYIDAGRMRFAINVDSAERAGLRLSSRLLGLATVIRDSDVQ
jgi:hypothetical protein